MKFYRRPLAPGETDVELLWFWTSLASVGLAFLWLRWHLPLPECVIARWTGWPCPTCGGTRMVRSILEGNLGRAIAWNPLVFLGLCGSAIFSAYSAVTLVFRLRRVRCGKFPEKFRYILWSAALILLVANWIYLAATLSVGNRRLCGETGADFHGGSAMHRDVCHAQRTQLFAHGGERFFGRITIATKMSQDELPQISLQ